MKQIRTLQILLERLSNIEDLDGTLDCIVEEMVYTFVRGGKLITAGNGGSASQAEHIAGEFVGKFYKDREPLPACALTVPSASFTAIGNDYGYKYTLSRQVEAFGRSEDFLLVLSTSGKSKNVIEAVKHAKNVGMMTACLKGQTVTELDTLCRYVISVPSEDTPRIQECHILIGHIIAEMVEKEMFP